MNKAVQVRIKGKVQGVGYRAATLGKAKALGLRGYVKNEPDGDVTAFFEGTEAMIAAMLLWCESGPIRAKVTALITEYQAPRNYPDFSIV